MTGIREFLTSRAASDADLDRLLCKARFSFCLSVDLREFADGDDDAADNDDSVVMEEKEKVHSMEIGWLYG